MSETSKTRKAPPTDGTATEKTAKSKIPFAIPTMLSYGRSIPTSMATFHGIRGDGTVVPVVVYEETLTGAQGAYANGYEKDFLPKPVDGGKDRIDAPNPKTVHRAVLPVDCDRLEIRFGVVIEPNVLAPMSCALHPIHDRLVRFADLASEKGVLRDLAARYAWNLVNGRTIWRNGMLEDMEAHVTAKGFDATFSCYDYALDAFPGMDIMSPDFVALVDIVEKGLARRGRGTTHLRIRISGGLHGGTDLYPSQEFVNESTASRDRRNNKRVLASHPVLFEGRMVDQAVMHSQKIGNALRTIDEWHDMVGELGPIPVENYGFVRNRGLVARAPGKSRSENRDSYAILRDIDVLIADLEQGRRTNDAMYLAALLVRGAVLTAGAKD